MLWQLLTTFVAEVMPDVSAVHGGPPVHRDQYLFKVAISQPDLVTETCGGRANEYGSVVAALFMMTPLLLFLVHLELQSLAEVFMTECQERSGTPEPNQPRNPTATVRRCQTRR